VLKKKNSEKQVEINQLKERIGDLETQLCGFSSSARKVKAPLGQSKT